MMSESSATDAPPGGEAGSNNTNSENNQSGLGLFSALATSGSSSALEDVDSTDGFSPSESGKNRSLIGQLQAKIQRTMEFIKKEQTNKEAIVNEYLRLSSNADKQQVQRIKTVFEKKNQKSTQTIAQLQKKLENYRKRLVEAENPGATGGHKQAKEVFRDMGQGLKNVGANFRDGVVGAKDTIVSKPKEFAHLIKNRFGSADNIASLKSQEDGPEESEKTIRSTGQGRNGATLPSSFQFTPTHTSEEEQPADNASDITSGSVPSMGRSSSQPHSHSYVPQITQADLARLIHDVKEDAKHRMQQDCEELRQRFHEELSWYKQMLEEERYRSDRTEEQLNDLTELHQHEVTNIKQELSSMEEKMEYQLEERTRDMQDLLESCQTRITKMELQQQQQQLISMEGFENSNFRALVTKLINVVLALLAVVLVLVSTLANLLSPFLTTRLRILTTIILIASIVAVVQNWSFVTSFSQYIVDKYKQFIPFQ